MSLSCILLWIRSIYKVVIHTLTGQTEIERIARRNDPVALCESWNI